jgi:hypothetical protein
MDFIDYLTEAPEKHGVLAYGRMNPPTSGHEQVINKVHEVAKEHNAVHKVVLSHSQDKSKNPLPADVKVKHAQHAFPGTNIEAASKEHPTILHHAAAIASQGVKHLHVVAGSDRVEEYHKLLLESKLCIWLGRHESQGFAFQEALSYNVPLLVYDVLDMKEEVNDHNVSVYASYNRISLPATSAAFWDPICGEKTTNPKDIDPLLKKMMGSLDKYRPREFVERELSDKVCFKRVLGRFGF